MLTQIKMYGTTETQTTSQPYIENMNNLNAPPSRLPPPDILQNVPCSDADHRASGSQRRDQQSTEKRPAVVFEDGRVCRCKACRNITKHKSKGYRRMVRGLCCFGWIFCCPIFTMAWALRTAPVDKQDLQEDDCYPCYTSAQ